MKRCARIHFNFEKLDLRHCTYIFGPLPPQTNKVKDLMGIASWLAKNVCTL